jgi:hypothetical protein
MRYETALGVSVYIPFYGMVTVIGGDSSSGKSFVKDTAQVRYNDVGMSMVEVFDYKGPIDLSVLRACKGKLVIIDNANVLLDGNDAACKHINTDEHNQYLLFMRERNTVDISTDTYAELRQVGRKIEAVYPFR